MTSSQQRNDAGRLNRKGPFRPKNPHGKGGHGGGSKGPEGVSELIWGWHPVVAALENRERAKPKRVMATAEKAQSLAQRFGKIAGLEVMEAGQIGQSLPAGAVHQGVALRIAPLPGVDLAELAADPAGVIVVLDGITDPQNVGAIFRSAAAFGARGVVLQDRHAPILAGALAKAAAGAIDKTPHARVTNLSRALETLAEAGWRCVGLDGESPVRLDQALDGSPTVLVMGSEGKGLRRLVLEHCDAAAQIPMPGGFESLNVSAAAAVALYEATRPR